MSENNRKNQGWILVCLTVLHAVAGDRPTMTSTPDHPTRVFIGENVSLAWHYYFPTHLNILEISFGVWKSPGYISMKLMAVSSSGVLQVRKGFERKVGWAGNLTSKAAVFVLYDVQPADGNKTFGVNIEFGTHYQPLTSTVRLQVNAKESPKITKITRNQTVQEADHVVIFCRAEGNPTPKTQLHKVNSTQVSEPALSYTELSITIVKRTDAGLYRCLANNELGQDERMVLISVEPGEPASNDSSTNTRGSDIEHSPQTGTTAGIVAGSICGTVIGVTVAVILYRKYRARLKRNNGSYLYLVEP